MKEDRKKKSREIEELVVKAKDGDKRALQDIIDNYKGLIMKEASKYKIPSHEFEDIIQTGYLTVIKCVKIYRAGSNEFHGYVINGIKNNMRFLLRDNMKNYKEIPDEFILNKGPIDLTLSIEEHIIANEAARNLYAAMDELDPEEREIIENFYLKKKNMRKHTEGCDIKYRRLMYRKRQILEKLQKIIRKNENTRETTYI